jgi:hypothetical protein
MIEQFWQRGKFKDLKAVVPYGKSKVQDLLKRDVWREGLHYVTDDAGDRIYNLDLVADWMANMNDPIAHQRACELYLASLPSNQAKCKTPKSQSGKAA